MRVLNAVTSLGHGGIEKWLLSMMAPMKISGVDLDFCCKGSDKGVLAAEAHAFGAQVHQITMNPTLVGFAGKLKELLIRGRYDIFHNHLGPHAGIGAYVARTAGVKTIASYHNTRFGPQTPFTRMLPIRLARSAYARASIKYALRNSDLITGCSKAVIDTLESKFAKIPVAHRALYYGVAPPPALSGAEMLALRQSIGAAEGDRVLLHVGRLVEQKNHVGLIRIFKAVHDRCPNTRLLLVGDGLLRHQVKEQVVSLGLSSAVHLLGLRNDVPQLMQISDLFVFPSHYEGFGLVCVEAASAGLPIVATDIPGVIEAVRHGENAELFQLNDEPGMAKAIVDLIGDTDKRAIMSAKGRALVDAEFSIQAAARNLLAAYGDTLHGRL